MKIEFNKYQNKKIQENERPVFSRWEDSVDVLRLVEYLGINPDLGARLCWNNGAPSLVFDPPAKNDNSVRWQRVVIAASLLQSAARDLRELHYAGLYVLPPSPHQGEENGHINNI
jgi:hypothetical protein